MPTKGRYLEAMGFDSDHTVKTDLTPDGALKWGLSKAPAVAGGMWAQWVYDWACKKWPNVKRGPEFVGGVCVVIGAYAMQVLVTRMQPTYGHLVDKLTDGMIGRISPVVVRLFKGFFPGKQAEKPAQGLTVDSASLDGDREAVVGVAQLLSESPETTQLLADQLYSAMKRDGHDVDEAGRLAIVASFREVTQNIARGQF